ncbi:ATP-dependent helicase [Jannaschia sp. Os4]|uniref:UvrD-helicase domain-containing protein n=1 Tax=Jannaschia sp. Os4 TaxID=2807617 RepID=UPI00193AAAF0|nr:UvrD-helicase domain-containing protein [Jannaschia sp. Os4]MBM2576417.1 ATP-dependent helicase [Jannaschia sp. Os4]
MTNMVPDDRHDAAADETIRACLDLTAPQSFFLYAGAGSGKTRSLVGAIAELLERQGRRLSLTSQKIAVITYTNAATDEIRQRLAFDPRVEVSTIHAFAWSLIRGYDQDIREWVRAELGERIGALEDQIRKGRAGTDTARRRERDLERRRARLAGLGVIERFIYSPTGDNRTRDALNHAEVIAMTSAFLTERAGLRRQVVCRYPVLLVDESQDTAARLMDGLLTLQRHHPREISLGLFGDTMQRIYMDGKPDLADAIPEDWQRPRKAMNHRCPARIVRLVNAVRADDDGQVQVARSDAATGHVRVFLVPPNGADASSTEDAIRVRMAEVTGDRNWQADGRAVKTLALEHLMSARRLGFASLFEPLNRINASRTSLLNGTDPSLRFFTGDVLPLVRALRDGDRFAVAACVRRHSPLLAHERLVTAGDQQRDILSEAKAACDGLGALVSGATSPSLRAVLHHVAATNLLTIPDALQPFADAEAAEPDEWGEALDASLAEVEAYDDYIRGLSRFDTHQGVKGLEFPRVMVVLSDDEARGFLFSYDKFFGVTAKTAADLKKEAEGSETGIDRTRRLFYVVCSRARKSLAIVYYTTDCEAARRMLIERAWFEAEEIETWPPKS